MPDLQINLFQQFWVVSFFFFGRLNLEGRPLNPPSGGPTRPMAWYYSQVTQVPPVLLGTDMGSACIYMGAIEKENETCKCLSLASLFFMVMFSCILELTFHDHILQEFHNTISHLHLSSQCAPKFTIRRHDVANGCTAELNITG